MVGVYAHGDSSPSRTSPQGGASLSRAIITSPAIVGQSGRTMDDGRWTTARIANTIKTLASLGGTWRLGGEECGRPSSTVHRPPSTVHGLPSSLTIMI